MPTEFRPGFQLWDIGLRQPPFRKPMGGAPSRVKPPASQAVDVEDNLDTVETSDENRSAANISDTSAGSAPLPVEPTAADLKRQAKARHREAISGLSNPERVQKTMYAINEALHLTKDEEGSEEAVRARMLSAIYSWIKYTALRHAADIESDRRGIETAIAVHELEMVYGVPLSTYPLPDSSADCDDCGRQNCYRFYHLHSDGDMLDEGVDLCERCYVGGDMVKTMKPELFLTFSLVAPLIDAGEAWQDIKAREQVLAQFEREAQAADEAQRRSEMHFAARLFTGACREAQMPSGDCLMVEVRFKGGSQQAMVHRRSRAFALSRQDPSKLGDEILRIIADMKDAPQLTALQRAIKDHLLMPGDFGPKPPPPRSPMYQLLESMGVGIVSREPPPPAAAVPSQPTASAIRPKLMLALTTNAAEAPPQLAPSPRGPAQTLASTANTADAPPQLAPSPLGAARASSYQRAGRPVPLRTTTIAAAAMLHQYRLRGTMAPSGAAPSQQGSQAQSSTEATFLLRQVENAVTSMSVNERVQTQVRFHPDAPTMPISVPIGCQAASMDPSALGQALLDATRKAKSLADAKAMLENLLRPTGGVRNDPVTEL